MMLSKWFGRGKAKEKASPQEHVIQVRNPTIQIVSTNPQELRAGKWITYQGYVGIAAEVNPNTVDMHFVDMNGVTVGRDYVATKDVQLAKYLEIPSSRRGDIRTANYLGYQ